MIFYLAYIFFQAVSAVPTGRVDVVFPAVETSRSGMKTVKFRALNQDIELKLEPAGEILAKDFVFVNSKQPFDVEKLRRKIYRDIVNGAALLIDENGPSSIKGIVNSNLRIEPHESGRQIGDGIRAHRIVEIRSDEDSYNNDIVTSMEIEKQADNLLSMGRQDKCLVLEILSVTEYKLTRRFKADEALTEYITTLFTGAENLLKGLDSRIKIRLIGIDARKKGQDPSYIKQSEYNDTYIYLVTILGNMKKYYCEKMNELEKSADLIMLILTREMIKVVDNKIVQRSVGKAAAPMSANAKSCRILGRIGLQRRVDTVAHEVAHMLGVPHDGIGTEEVNLPNGPGAKDCPPSTGFIMGNRNAANQFKFSECSKKCAKYLLSLPRASCLFEDCKSFRLSNIENAQLAVISDYYANV
uniref:Putative metalloproteinase n=1 Tax=Tityus obscurus TaxID=1221240 RepID=A0A1E1WW34_TITOB